MIDSCGAWERDARLDITNVPDVYEMSSYPGSFYHIGSASDL